MFLAHHVGAMSSTFRSPYRSIFRSVEHSDRHSSNDRTEAESKHETPEDAFAISRSETSVTFTFHGAVYLPYNIVSSYNDWDLERPLSWIVRKFI